MKGHWVCFAKEECPRHICVFLPSNRRYHCRKETQGRGRWRGGQEERTWLWLPKRKGFPRERVMLQEGCLCILHSGIFAGRAQEVVGLTYRTIKEQVMKPAWGCLQTQGPGDSLLSQENRRKKSHSHPPSQSLTSKEIQGERSLRKFFKSALLPALPSRHGAKILYPVFPAHYPRIPLQQLL